MPDEWFYAAGSESIGPLSLRHLLVVLRKMPDAETIQVWNDSFANWQEAKSVPEIASALFQAARNRRASTPPSQTNLRRLLSIALAAIVALAVIATLTTLVFDNSPEGIAQICGEFSGPVILLSLFAIPLRKATYTPAVVLLLGAALTLLGNQRHIVDVFTVRDAQATLKDIHSPIQLDDAVARNPRNALLKIMAEAAKLAQESGRRAQALSEQIEPPELNQNLDPATATRDELAKYITSLKTAERNANAATTQLLAIQQDERERLERYARSVSFSEVASLLNGVDKRHAREAEFNSRMMKARADVYGAYATDLTILLEQYGRYTVETNGQIRFSEQSTATRYNNASNALSEAAKRVAALDAERKEIVQSQQAGWEHIVGQGSRSQ
jgi:hypothetical protein